MKIKLIFLILGFSLLSQFSYSQIKGKVGKYGIDKLPDDLYENGTIEGIVQNVNGKLIIKDCLKCENSPGPIIMIYNNWVQIGGKYNKKIDYFKGGSVTQPFLSIEIYKDNSRDLVQEIYYTKNNKRTSTIDSFGSLDYNNSVNEKFDGNFQEIINNEITKARNSIVGYNLFVKEKNSNSQNSSVVSNNKSTTTKPKKYTTPPLHLSTKELGEWFDSEEGQKYLQQSGMLSAVGNEILNQAGSSSSNSSSRPSSNNNSSECNKKFKFRIWKGGQYSSGNYWGGWADEETSKPGFVKCPSCNGYGVNWDYDNNEGRPRSKNCYNNSCNGGWVPCNH